MSNYAYVQWTEPKHGAPIRGAYDMDNPRVPWFSLADLCKHLGLKESQLSAQAGEHLMIGRGPYGERTLLYVSEEFADRMTLMSKEPIAGDLYLWITLEVVPAMRKHGFYQVQSALESSTS